MVDLRAVGNVVSRSVSMATTIAQQLSQVNMLAEVAITRPTGKPGFDRATGQQVLAALKNVYTGNARVYSDDSQSSYDLGEEQQVIGQTYVSIPISAARPLIGDDVEILDHPDSEMVSRHFKVVGVSSGGLIPAVRRLTVTGIEPQPGQIGTAT